MESIHLNGADDVARAGRAISSAADTISRAADNISGSNDRMLMNLQGILDQFISGLREVLQEADLAAMAPKMLKDGYMRHTVSVGNIVDVIEGTPAQTKEWIDEHERMTRVGTTGDILSVADSDPLVTYTISIARNGDVTNDVQSHGNTFAEVYRGFVAIKAEVDRQIEERRECPFNPKYGSGDIWT